MSELKSCHSCGEEAAFINTNASIFVGQDYGDRYPEGVRRQHNGYQVRCDNCGLQTCWWHYEQEAIDSWNARAPQQPQPATRYLIEDCHGPRMYISDKPVTRQGYRCTPLQDTPIAQPAAVPSEPTKEMLVAARDWSLEKYGKSIGDDSAIGCYKAMLNAAPSPAVVSGEPYKWEFEQATVLAEDEYSHYITVICKDKPTENAARRNIKALYMHPNSETTK